jgi:hypothetical protein
MPENIRTGQLAAEANRRQTREAYADLVPIERRLRENGNTLQSISTSRYGVGHRTQGGGERTSAGIHHFRKRERLGHLHSRSRVRPPNPQSVQEIETAIAGKERTANARIA